jgi:hypothetical protein
MAQDPNVGHVADCRMSAAMMKCARRVGLKGVM